MDAWSTIPSGNAEILEIREDRDPHEVHVAAAPGYGPEAIWFYFVIDPGSVSTPAIDCVLHFFENLLGNQVGADSQGLHPVYRTETEDWTRIEVVKRVETPDGRLLVSWTVPGDAGRVEVALSYPYGQAQLEALSHELEDSFMAAPIGLTSAGHVLQRLANNVGAEGADRPGIYCLARQHAAEAPGSWVLDGFLRYMAQQGASAPLVWAVPFTDTDGVLAGSAGKDRFPWDFNRAWGSIRFPDDLKAELGSHPMRHEIKALQNDLLRWRQRCRPCLVLDFHAPTICESLGIYMFLRDLDAEGRPDAKHAPWVDAIQEGLDPRMRAGRFVRSGRYVSRWNSARVGDFVTRALNLPAITFETPYACSEHCLFTRKHYRRAGEQIGQAVMQRAAMLSAAPGPP